MALLLQIILPMSSNLTLNTNRMDRTATFRAGPRSDGRMESPAEASELKSSFEPTITAEFSGVPCEDFTNFDVLDFNNVFLWQFREV